MQNMSAAAEYTPPQTRAVNTLTHSRMLTEDVGCDGMQLSARPDAVAIFKLLYIDHAFLHCRQGVLVPGRVQLLMKPGDTCFRGYGRRDGERRRKSVRGCIVSQDLSVLNLIIVKRGALCSVPWPRRRSFRA